MPIGSRGLGGRRVGMNPRWTRVDRWLIAWVILCMLGYVTIALLSDWERPWQGPGLVAMNLVYVGVGIWTGLPREDQPGDRAPRPLFVMRALLGLYALTGFLCLGAALLFYLFIMNVQWGGIR